MDIGGWLRGLGRYETTFRENEIDAEVHPELTESDLSQLGVPLGHRKRLLKAIAALAQRRNLLRALFLRTRRPIQPSAGVSLTARSPGTIFRSSRLRASAAILHRNDQAPAIAVGRGAVPP